MLPRIPGRMPVLLPAVALVFSLAGSSVGLAQSNPLALPPPGYTNPGEAGTAASDPANARTAKKPTRRKAREAQAATGATATKRQRGENLDLAPTATTETKQRRFVPEEFDDDGSGGSPRPYMSPTGRAGIGMKF